jgi:hypothetical protein
VLKCVFNWAGFLIVNAIKYAFLSEGRFINNSHCNFVLIEYTDKTSSGPNVMSNRIHLFERKLRKLTEVFQENG